MRARFCICIVWIAVTAGVLPAAHAPQAPGSAEPALAADERGRTSMPRDPFVRPTQEGIDARVQPGSAPPRAVGLPGLSIDDLTVRGVFRAVGRSIAVVQAPDSKQYLVGPGDRLRDGRVEAVVSDALVMVADRDGTTSEGARRVRRSLRGPAEGR